jgi:hypothetical protein
LRAEYEFRRQYHQQWHVLDTSHMAMLSKPKEVAPGILAAAAAVKVDWLSVIADTADRNGEGKGRFHRHGARVDKPNTSR